MAKPDLSMTVSADKRTSTALVSFTPTDGKERSALFAGEAALDILNMLLWFVENIPTEGGIILT